MPDNKPVSNQWAFEQFELMDDQMRLETIARFLLFATDAAAQNNDEIRRDKAKYAINLLESAIGSVRDSPLRPDRFDLNTSALHSKINITLRAIHQAVYFLCELNIKLNHLTTDSKFVDMKARTHRAVEVLDSELIEAGKDFYRTVELVLPVDVIAKLEKAGMKEEF